MFDIVHIVHQHTYTEAINLAAILHALQHLCSYKTWSTTTSYQNLADITREADIVVSALGVPNFLTADMVKDGAIIIDVGITRVPDADHPKGYVIVGDVHFDQVKEKASYITPVPGGVGPMTIAMLLQNTMLAYQRNQD